MIELSPKQRETSTPAAPIAGARQNFSVALGFAILSWLVRCVLSLRCAARNERECVGVCVCVEGESSPVSSLSSLQAFLDAV